MSSIEVRAKALQTYLDSWSTADGKLRGVVITYWDQQLDPIEHVMHYYPLILAYVRQHQAGRSLGSREPLSAAKRMGDRLIALQDTSGMYTAAWGDVPPKNTAPVLQAAPAYALARLYQATGDAAYRDSALRAYQYLKAEWWDGVTLRNYVVNQTSTFLALLIELYQITANHQFLQNIHDNLSWILNQQHRNGGFPQAKHDLRMFLVYNAKTCLGLLAALDVLDDRKRIRIADALRQQAHFLINHMQNSGGGALFASHVQPPGYHYPVYLQQYRSARLFPNGRDMLYKVLRSAPFTKTERAPVWIARSALIVYVLHRIANELDDDEIHAAVRYAAQTLLEKQYANGAFPNAISFKGTSHPTWCDVAAPTRWNAYAYLLLTEFALDGIVMKSPDFYPADNIAVAFEETGHPRIWDENQSEVLIRTSDGDILDRVLKHAEQSL